MSYVRRYDPLPFIPSHHPQYAANYGGMKPSEQGNYVLYADYKEIIAQLSQCQAELGRVYVGNKIEISREDIEALIFMYLVEFTEISKFEARGLAEGIAASFFSSTLQSISQKEPT